MIKNFPPNTNPQLYSITAVIVGYAITDDFNVPELNSIGNWLILVGQYLLTFASQQQMIESRIDNNNININSKQAKTTGNPYTNGKSNQNTRQEVEYLLEAVNKMQKELENYTKKKS
jgi:hypothetical protein